MHAPAAYAWRENRPPTKWLPRFELGELWLYRELVYHLALRDMKLRYKQAAFGVAWAILPPLLGALVFTVVFGSLGDFPSDGIAYAVFAYSGMIIYVYLSRSVDASALSLVEYRDLVTKVYFPRALAPFASVLPGLVDVTVSLFILAGFAIGYGETPGPALITLPFWVAAAAAVALGAGLWISALNVLYRDVRFTIPFVLQLWLFVSPVVFPSSSVDGDWRFLFALNPAVGVIDGFRWSAIGGPAPEAQDLISLASGVLLLIGGAVYFQHVERRMADRI